VKTYIRILILFIFACSVFSCSKKNGNIACTAQYIAPTFKFKMIGSTSGNDLFFSTAAEYPTSALKVYFKNPANKLDSVAPSVEEDATAGKHFVYSTPALRANDTCFLKINGVLSNTVSYTISTINPPCNAAFINSVKIDNDNTIAYKTGDIATIKK